MNELKKRWQTFTGLCGLCGGAKDLIRTPSGKGWRIWRFCSVCDSGQESRCG